MRDFNHTVNVLVKAYLNDTLIKGYCYACAVGNLIKDAGVDLPPYEGKCEAPSEASEWLRFIQRNIRMDNRFNYNPAIAEKQIKSTGYSAEELSKIESAFESGGSIFNSLMDCVDVLADIHGIDLKAKEEAKLLFVKA